MTEIEKAIEKNKEALLSLKTYDKGEKEIDTSKIEKAVNEERKENS